MLAKKVKVAEAVANNAIDIASSVESNQQDTVEELDEIRGTAVGTTKKRKGLWRVVNVIDNRTRAKNVVVYVLTPAGKRCPRVNFEMVHAWRS